MSAAVIVTTYNRPDALIAVLEAFAAQSVHPAELIVADDGSTHETQRAIDAFAARAPFPVRHVWQEDRGFRAAAVRNKALSACRAQYVIFTDGDCIPARHFIAQHIKLAQRGWFLSGHRILLSKAFTRRVLQEHLRVHEWTPRRWFALRMQGAVNRWIPLLRLGDGRWRMRAAHEWRGVKTCNLSLWREDLVRVNGLDEAYSGWGLEDSDLVIRLLHAGVRHKSARFAAPVFHLWHQENDRSRLPENQSRLDELMRSDRVRAQLGLDRYATGSS